MGYIKFTYLCMYTHRALLVFTNLCMSVGVYIYIYIKLSDGIYKFYLYM